MNNAKLPSVPKNVDTISVKSSNTTSVEDKTLVTPPSKKSHMIEQNSLPSAKRLAHGNSFFEKKDSKKKIIDLQHELIVAKNEAEQATMKLHFAEKDLEHQKALYNAAKDTIYDLEEEVEGLKQDVANLRLLLKNKTIATREHTTDYSS